MSRVSSQVVTHFDGSTRFAELHGGWLRVYRVCLLVWWRWKAMVRWVELHLTVDQEVPECFRGVEGSCDTGACFEKLLEVHTDASDLSIGGVLMQEGHPMAFESCKLNDTERGYRLQEKEMTAIVHCLRTRSIRFRSLYRVVGSYSITWSNFFFVSNYGYFRNTIRGKKSISGHTSFNNCSYNY